MRVTQSRWLAKRRQPATFHVRARSAVFKDQTIDYTVVVTETGYVVTRRLDGTRVAITWREAIGLALFHGRGIPRGEEPTW